MKAPKLFLLSILCLMLTASLLGCGKKPSKEETKIPVRAVQVKKGASEEEALAAVDLPKFKKYKGYRRALKIAVRRIYRELTVGLP